MEMEDKESTESGSPVGNSDFDSPPSSGGGYGGGGGMVPGLVNMSTGTEKIGGPAMNSAAAPMGGGPTGGVINNNNSNNGGVISGGVMGGGVSGGSGGGGELVVMGKKKRGRPRKYDADGNLSAAYMRSPTAQQQQQQTAPSQGGFTLSTPPSYEYSTSGSKRGRGRGGGSSGGGGGGNWQTLASLGELFASTAGGDFTPHVVTVFTGEDVAGKILTFAQKGHRGICVLSANGSVSNVTIRQPGSSGGLLTYEGRFELLTLTGSFTISDNGGIKSRSGGLSVTLASPDGRVIGGGVAGLLMAATPIQIVVGSFVPNGYNNHKPQKRRQKHAEHRISPTVHSVPATVTAAVPISQSAPEGNIYHQMAHDNSLSNKDHPNSASTDSADWNDSGPGSDQRPSPDINISVPLEEH